jgi:1-acyl-sn-glycerol-3-phosphate acyltransferase
MSLWKRLISWCITPFFLLFFADILVIFHVLQLVVYPFSRRLQKHVLDLMNLCIILNIRVCAGASFRVIRKPRLPPGRPVILVANHQSMYDIPMMMWVMRDRELGFIAKRELGKGIPSISFALRTLGSVLIDRKDVQQAIPAIEAFGRRKEEEKQVACIFPEGTRARDGVMKRFKSTGFSALLSSMPSAIIQPVVVRGNWELLRYQFRPVPYGVSISLDFLDPIEPNGRGAEELTALLEGTIRGSLEQSEHQIAA